MRGGDNMGKILYKRDRLMLVKLNNDSFKVIHDGFQILTQDYAFAINYLEYNLQQNRV